MSDRHQASEPTRTRKKPGRPPSPDTRHHCCRFALNTEELTKFRILARLNHDISLNAMVRDIVLDELNTVLSEYPRHELIAALEGHGLDQTAIDSLLKSI
jgi:hypothetical protein